MRAVEETASVARRLIDSLETQSAPLTVPATDDEQRIAVRMPGGFEYKEAEVALATLLSSSAEVKFDWKGTHSSLAKVEHTNEALVA